MDVTRYLQIEIKALVDVLLAMKEEAGDIYSAYWATDANTAVGALGSSDAATMTTKLTKTVYLSGITLCEQVNKFFTNQALAQANYITSCQNIIYGNTARTSKLTEATEALGSRMVVVAQDCISTFKKADEIIKAYNENEIGTMVTDISASRAIPGSDMIKSELVSGITLLQQFSNLLSNAVATQGDYAATLASWKRL